MLYLDVVHLTNSRISFASSMLTRDMHGTLDRLILSLKAHRIDSEVLIFLLLSSKSVLFFSSYYRSRGDVLARNEMYDFQHRNFNVPRIAIHYQNMVKHILLFDRISMYQFLPLHPLSLFQCHLYIILTRDKLGRSVSHIKSIKICY